MYLANVKFQASRKIDRSKLKNLVDDYMTWLYRNGQIGGMEWSYASIKGTLNAFVDLTRPDAFERRYMGSEFGLPALENLENYLGNPPQWTLLEEDVPKRFPNWKSARFLFLWHYWLIDPMGTAVRRGNDGKPIPTYLLPIAELDRQYISSWEHYYDELQMIWFRSGAWEIPAYRELADPRSELSTEGRKLCEEIEKATAIPTYYPLFRWWGRRKGEPTRLCPDCGRRWRVWPVNKAPSDKPRFWEFPFRCEKCRLVSHDAQDFDDERHARIGEFKPRKKPRKR